MPMTAHAAHTTHHAAAHAAHTTAHAAHAAHTAAHAAHAAELAGGTLGDDAGGQDDTELLRGIVSDGDGHASVAPP